jgi:hypothetical protein
MKIYINSKPAVIMNKKTAVRAQELHLARTVQHD